MSARNPGLSLPLRRASANGVEHTRTFELLARAGFVARGVIYGIVGILAVKLALGAGGNNASQTGALKTLAHQPLGKVLLILVATGLGGYSLWRLVHTVLGRGPERSDSGFDRLAALGSGIAYGLLCAVAVELLLGSGASSSAPEKSTAGVLGWPGGAWIAGLAGAVFVGVALYQAYRGLTQDFLEDAKTERMRATTRRWYKLLAVFGHLARTVVFALIGVFLIKAAIDFDPNKAVGVDGALAKVAHQAYGSVLLGVVAAGLIAFGLYSLVDARYRRI